MGLPTHRDQPGGTMARVNEARFFAGFVAALRARGVDFVETQDDSHHARFNRVVQALREARANSEPGVRGMPRSLMPTQVTGRYRELDEALLNMQRGIFSAPNPYYPGVQLKLSEDRAERILSDFDPEQRKLLARLADLFAASQ